MDRDNLDENLRNETDTLPIHEHKVEPIQILHKSKKTTFRENLLLGQFILSALTCIISTGLLIKHSYHSLKLSMQMVRRLKKDERVKEMSVKALAE